MTRYEIEGWALAAVLLLVGVLNGVSVGAGPRFVNVSRIVGVTPEEEADALASYRRWRDKRG